MVPRVPARGRYDRASSASERAQQQHDVLLSAALDYLSQSNTRGELSVSVLCQATGMGRNTVYGLFENAQVITDTVVASCNAAVERALQSAEIATGTPLGAAAAFVDTWLAFCADSPAELRVAALWNREQLLRTVVGVLRQLVELGRTAGLFAADPSGMKVQLLSAAAIEAGLAVASQPEQLAPARAALLDVITKAAR